jgi:mannitol/fructose-specific phosphotransferase system IIA component (Ntr-type)
MTISAMPVAIRAMHELNILKTDMGFLIVSALSINDILGWIIFTILLGVFTQAAVNIVHIATVFTATLGFVAFSLVVLRKLADRTITSIKQKFPEKLGISITFITILGLICGAVTQRIGIHSLFGFFIAGIMVGEAKALPEKSRQVISQMVHALFIPLFFVSVGLKVDFLKNFDPFFVAFIFILGTIARFVGAWIGVAVTGRHKANRMIISLAHIPGGEMQIVIGMLALEYKLITEPVFVAIVFGAVLTSIILGPLMALALKMKKSVNPLDYFLRRAVISDIDSKDRDSAIQFLSLSLSEEEGMPNAEEIYDTIIKREREMGTALESGVAIPHAHISGISSPSIVFARSIKGINWNSPDGKPTHFIFLIVVPEKDSAIHLKICQAIAKTMSNVNIGKSLMEAKDNRGILDIFTTAFRDIENS